VAFRLPPWRPTSRHLLWATRPELRDTQELEVTAIGLVFQVVAVAPTAALGLVGLILLIHG